MITAITMAEWRKLTFSGEPNGKMEAVKDEEETANERRRSRLPPGELKPKLQRPTSPVHQAPPGWGSWNTGQNVNQPDPTPAIQTPAEVTRLRDELTRLRHQLRTEIRLRVTTEMCLQAAECRLAALRMGRGRGP